MNDEIKINKANKSLTFINNGIAFSQFGIADEILDLITNLQQEKEDYKSRCEKASEYFKYQLENLDFYEDTKARMLCAMGITLLQNGSDSQC